MIGRTISHYRITAKLGEGGMGVVYKAEDTKLRRDVAIKFLAPHLVRDEEGRKRFEREAMAAAALDHPNVCTVYEIDEVDERTFIVMAFLEGRTLSKKIADGPLKLPEALSIAIQMAEGLEAAHEKGIVHRDIKPDNVMLMKGSRGLVKLMDFGLAQLAQSSKLTREGTTLGTPIYMSPEQAVGEPTDKRADVWAVGVVLYEMVAGQPPFRGERDQAVIYSIANEPHEPLTGVRTGVPKELERIVDKCLAKNADERYQHVTDLLVDLQACRRDVEPSAQRAATVTAVGRRRSASAWMTVGVALVVLAAAAWWFGGSKGTLNQPPQYNLKQLTFDTGLTHQPAISKDGSMIAYASDRAGNGNLDIWVQHVAGGQPRQVTDHEAEEEWPDLSPDGSLVVFRSDRDGGGIYLAPALGGSDRLLARGGFSPRVSPDGQWVAYADAEFIYHRSALHVVSISGGTPRKVEAGMPWATFPSWSPDGSNLLFVGGPEEIPYHFDKLDHWIVPAAGGRAVQTGVRKVLTEAGIDWAGLSGPGDAGSGHWLTAPDRIVLSLRSGQTSNIFQMPILPGSWQPAGSPARLTQGIAYVQPAAAPGGTIAFTNRTDDSDIWSVEFDPNRGEVTGEPVPLLTSAAREQTPTVSSDGRKLVFSRGPEGNSDIFVRDTETGIETPLVVTPQDEPRALISPDGETVVFWRFTFGKIGLFVTPSGGGDVRELLEDISTVTSWAWDSRRVVCLVENGAQWVTVDVVTGEIAPLIASAGEIAVPTFSPDGNWLSLKVGGPTYVAPIRDGAPAPRSEWTRLTQDEKTNRSWWSPNGEWLYFASDKDGDWCLWAQRLDPESKRPIGELKHVLWLHDRSRILSPWILGMAADRFYFQVNQTTANIWLAEPVIAP